MNEPPLMTLEEYTNLEFCDGDHCIAYGEDPSQFGELYLPSERRASFLEGLFGDGDKPLPVIVVFHGGCWSSKFNLDPLGLMCRALADKCHAAVWNLEYRRWENGGGWPHTFLDAAHGLDILEEMAQEFNLDLENIVACGHSAGGQLALWLAARSKDSHSSLDATLDPLPIKSVVALAPVCDLERASAPGVCGSAVTKMMGGPCEKIASHYDAGSPIALLPLGVRHVSMIGTRDKVVSMGSVAPFVGKAKEMGDDASLIAIEGAGHFELVDPDTPAGRLVVETILDELNR